MARYFVDVTMEVDAPNDEQAQALVQQAMDDLDTPGIESSTVFEPYQLLEEVH